MVSNLPFGSGAIWLWSSQAHLATSAPFRAGHQPVSGRLCGTGGGGAAITSRVPVAFRPTGIRFLAILSRRGDRPSSRSAHRAAPPARTPSGFPRSTRDRHDRVGRPLYPGDGGVLPVGGSLSDRHPPLHNGQSLHPAGNFRLQGPNVTRHHRGFTRVRPSGLPLACDLRADRSSSGFSPGLRTPSLPTTHAKVGTDHQTLVRATPSTSVESPIGVSTQLVRPRVARNRRCPAAATPTTAPRSRPDRDRGSSTTGDARTPS